jgi:hypothetical protein
MGKTYTATIGVRCIREHTCVCCGATYSYELVRDVKGQGGTAEKAQKNAEVNVKRALERDVDQVPCPTCGLYQPDMVADRRLTWFSAVFWIALIAFVAILILRLTYVFREDTAVWAAAGACAVAALALLKADSWNPNKVPEMNREVVTGRVATGKVRYQGGRLVPGSQATCWPQRGALHKLALVVVLLAVGLAAAPELLRLSRGWPVNEASYPPVVGAGDTARIYMNGKIHSIKSYWRGRPSAVVRAEGENARTLAATARTNDNRWGSTISAKSSEKDSTSTPWVEVTLPADADTLGKQVTADLRIDVEYPHYTGSSSYQTVRDHMERSVPLRLASAGAGTAYDQWWWQGTVAAMGLVLVCELILAGGARRLRRQAKPVRAIMPDAPPVPPTQATQATPVPTPG